MEQLVLPTNKYKKSYLEAVREFLDAGETRYAEQMYADEEHFNEFVQGLLDQSKGISLPDGYVPATVFWLVDDEEFIGRVSIRHILNEYLSTVGGHIGYVIRPSKRKMGYGSRILTLGLEKAEEMGLGRVLITCDATNIASKKVIEKNGGVFENTVKTEGEPDKMRYWINLQ